MARKVKASALSRAPTGNRRQSTPQTILLIVGIGMGVIVVVGWGIFVLSGGGELIHGLAQMAQESPARPVQASPRSPAPVQREATWVVVRRWSGTGDKTTEPFTVSAPWRVRWRCSPTGSSGGLFRISVDETNGCMVASWDAAEDRASQDVSYVYDSGSFYLDISVLWMSWEVTVEAQK